MNTHTAGTAVTIGTKTVHTVVEKFPGSRSFITACTKRIDTAVATDADVTCKTCAKSVAR